MGSAEAGLGTLPAPLISRLKNLPNCSAAFWVRLPFGLYLSIGFSLLEALDDELGMGDSEAKALDVPTQVLHILAVADDLVRGVELFLLHVPPVAVPSRG